jgi:fatty acid desaturase
MTRSNTRILTMAFRGLLLAILAEIVHDAAHARAQVERQAQQLNDIDARLTRIEATLHATHP